VSAAAVAAGLMITAGRRYLSRTKITTCSTQLSNLKFINSFAIGLHSQCVRVFRSIRVQFSSQAIFQQSAINDFGLQDISRITAYFNSPSMIITVADPLDLNAVVHHFAQRVDQFTRRGSGYTLERINQLSATCIKFRPLGAAGSYIPTPAWIKNKHAVINVKNHNDQKCFVWSILSCLYPASHNPDRLQNYDQYEKTLNLDSLEFPLAVEDIPKFEAQNPTIAIHCIAADSKEKSFSILYLSPRVHQRDHTLTLLLLDDERRSKNHHYVFVKNLSSLIAHRSKDGHRSHVCLSCLQVFSSERVLKNHERCCLVHCPQQVVFPDPEQRKLSFESHRYEHPFDFYFVSDFESVLIKNQDESTNVINTHETAGFCLHRMTSHVGYQTAPITYSGPNAIEKFLELIFSESEKINDIMSIAKPMT